MINDRYTVYLHPNKYTSKPNKSAIGRISNEIMKHKCELNLIEILNALSEGQTILPNEMLNDIRKQTNFLGTNFIFIDIDNKDIDNKISLFDLIQNEFVQNNCLAIYETLSSTLLEPKFRLVFVTNKKLTSNYAYNIVYSEVLTHFPSADISCKDSSKLFFGGKKTNIVNIGNRLNIDAYDFDSDDVKSIVAITDLQLEFENYINDLDVVNMIKNRKLAKLKSYYNTIDLLENKIFVNRVEAEKQIYKLDMFKLLGIRPQKYFNCIVSFDSKPSANIFKLDSGEYIYKRFSDNKNKQYTFNNIQLFSKLMGMDLNETKLVMSDILGIQINYSTDIKDKERVINNCVDNFININKEDYPKIYKTFNRYTHIVKGIFDLTLLHKFERTTEGTHTIDFINYLGTSYMSKYIFGSTNSYKVEKVSRILNLLTYVGILTKLDENTMEESLLKQLEKSRNSNKNKYRKNLFSINIDGFDLDIIEKKCEDLWDSGYTFNNFKQDFVTMNVDIETSNKIFVQDKNKKISQKLVTFERDLKEILGNFENDFILEQNVKLELINKGYSKAYIEKNFNIVLNNLLYQLNLKKIRLTNETKMIYGINDINSKARPNIIVRL